MKEKLIIIGAGGHGKVVADIAINMNTYKEIFFLDDLATGNVMGIEVLGKSDDYMKWITEADYFVAIGNSKVRQEFLDKLEGAGASIATLVHPRATIGAHVEMGKGTATMAGAVINPDTKIGRGVIINTACSIDHDNVISDYCHISVGAHLAGTVKVGKHTMVGAGATIINNVEICEGVLIGAGATVIKSINEEGTYVGVPAEKK